MKKKNQTPDLKRRAFMEKILKGTIAGSVFLVIPAGPLICKIPEQIKGIRGNKYEMTSKKFAFIVDITSCIGCGSCCVADKREYNVPDHNYRTWVERYIKDYDDKVYVDSPNGALDGYHGPRKDIKKPIRDTFFVPKLCNMCKEPSCVQVCPVGATFKTPDGFVLIDKKHCVGCGYCIQACPYGARFLNPATNSADKCTWCYHRVRKGLVPACVNACPTGARQFGDLNDKNSNVFKKLNGPGVISVLKKEMGNQPALYYQGLRREVI